MKYAPIILFAYNRPWHVCQTVEALQNNELAAESDVFVYSDGPKGTDDIAAVTEVRKYISSINGFKSIKMIQRDTNWGLARSVIAGVSEILGCYGWGIIVEDDLVTSPFFLKYMNDALRVYKDNERVISIHGYVYPLRKNVPETFFIKGADCWGWGTWQRGWNLFDPDGSKLLHEIERRNLKRRFDYDGTFGYYRMLHDQVAGKNNSWAIRWYASALINDRLTLYPGRSLVHNIGNDNSGNHGGETKAYDTKVADYPVAVERLLADENLVAYNEFCSYFSSIKVPLHSRLWNRFIEFFSGCAFTLK
ncbi:glycosyltransferase [Geotalea sp. SG265]|uniref:glycosyltransferase n=1 Tax=Geotalea sp. SG265 TaxID=2922867 RepID=UPI001FAFE6E2|nr:glycosyltransferase [Geotalea sp. SG265]